MSASLDDLRSAFAEITEIHGCAPLQTPRNLLLALTGRVGAVASLVQWAPDAELGPAAVTQELRDELADCLVYLVELYDSMGVDSVHDAVTRIRGAVDGSTP